MFYDKNLYRTMSIFFFSFLFLTFFNNLIYFSFICFKLRRTSLLTFFNDIMSSHVINLESYQEHIVKLHRKNCFTTQIVINLRENFQVQVTSRTIKRRLQNWNVTVKRVKTNDSSKLRARITILFFQSDCIDEEILFFFETRKIFYWS